MIQINLVPDVKQEMLHAQRMRNVAISLSIVIGLVAVGIVVALALILGGQVAVQKIEEGQITSGYSKLSSVSDLDSALTIQNQLGTISSQNDKRTVDSRLLDVLAAINPPAPNDVKLSKVTLDPTQNTVTLEGSAVGGYPATDVFRKTILNTKITAKQQGNDNAAETHLTSNVTLQDTSYGEDATGAKVVRFTIIFTYPNGLFDNRMSDVKISTPSARVDVTDSKTLIPDSMFSQAATDLKENK
ncbi:MAG TPA: hypothetical protein VLF64_02005 [Candidatus Saccharimonadales bacterium]|nr:hypothetical protein [Candidatus Saccharimonadales bacterium]